MSKRKLNADLARAQRKFESDLDNALFSDNFERLMFADVFSLNLKYKSYYLPLEFDTLYPCYVRVKFDYRDAWRENFVFEKTMPYSLYDDEMDDLTREVERYVKFVDESRHREQVRQDALKKLTDEEREALGLQ